MDTQEAQAGIPKHCRSLGAFSMVLHTTAHTAPGLWLGLCLSWDRTSQAVLVREATAQEWQLPWLLAQSLTGSQRSLWNYKLMPEVLATAFKILAKKMLFLHAWGYTFNRREGNKENMNKWKKMGHFFPSQETTKVIILRLFSSSGLHHLNKAVSKSV